MNYFELHIGDYDSATAHLSLIEDAVYGRLLRLCYRTEAAVPADLKQVYRLVRAVSKPERDAVDQVLAEFFELREDGWHNARCDAEIERFIAGEPEREVRKANEDNRTRRHREERAALFKVITEAGEHAAWNAPIADLRAMVKRLQGEPATPLPRPDTQPVTAPATPVTATQAPVPSTQTPDTIEKEKGAQRSATTSRALVEGEVEPEDPAPGSGTAYGLAALAMRQKGCAASPGDPRLRILVDQGASVEEFQAVAAEAADKGKGPAWALTALVNRRREAAETRLAPGPDKPDWRESRDAVSTRGQQLGLGAWPDFEQESIRRGKPPSYGAYRTQVIAAAEAAGGST